jgi:peptide/nickel transport system ATP-binding protein
MVFQDPYTSLDPRQTVGSCIEEALRLHAPLSRPQRQDRAVELLDAVGLDERHLAVRPSGLSGGQRQRVAIARALAPEPPLLVLDEAVSALDVSIQAQVLNLLNDIRIRTGVAFLFISHDLAVVREIADEVLVLWHGRTVEHGLPSRCSTTRDIRTRNDCARVCPGQVRGRVAIPRWMSDQPHRHYSAGVG